MAAGTLPTQNVFVQYQFTMYFVTFGITNSPFFQNNWFEAFLWCAEFLGLGLVFVAFVFGVIIDRIGQLREERSALQDCQVSERKRRKATKFFFFLSIGQNRGNL